MSDSETAITSTHFDLTEVYDSELADQISALVRRAKDLGLPIVVCAITRSDDDGHETTVSSVGRQDADREVDARFLAVQAAARRPLGFAHMALAMEALTLAGEKGESPARA